MSSLRRVHLALLGGVAVLAAAPLACGGSDKPAASASFGVGGDAGAPPAAQPCAPGQPCPPAPPGSAPPASSMTTTDPNALAALLAAAAAAGSALLQPMGTGDAVEVGIRTAAAKYASGMSPEGDMAKANLAEGGHVGFVFQMDPTKCYTIVGYGVGTTDLDLNLLAPPFYNLLTAQDGMAGPTAVIGAAPKPMCPIAPIAVPYKIDIYAKKGGGPVGAQVYSRPKK
jgi:hypothetical protein